MYQLSVAIIRLRKLNGIKYKTYVFAAKSTGWLEFCCFGLGWAGLICEGLMNVCSKLRVCWRLAALLCSTRPTWLILVAEAGLRESGPG